MSYLLDAVREGREIRDSAAEAFRVAVRRAKDGGHSLREIGLAANMTPPGIQHVLRRTGKEGNDG